MSSPNNKHDVDPRDWIPGELSIAISAFVAATFLAGYAIYGHYKTRERNNAPTAQSQASPSQASPSPQYFPPMRGAPLTLAQPPIETSMSNYNSGTTNHPRILSRQFLQSGTSTP